MNNDMQLIKKDDLLIIRFYGEIDNLVSQKYREILIQTLQDKDYHCVIMNFEHVDFIDSSGIGLVLGRYNQIKAYGGKLYVTKLSHTTYKLFDLTGIFRIIECIDDESIPLVKVGNADESSRS